MEKIREIWHNFAEQIKKGMRRLEEKAGIKPQMKSRSSNNSKIVPGQARPQESKLTATNKKAAKIRRKSKQRVYRLKGYTTVAKINRKRQSERQQRLLRRIIIGIVIVLLIILFFNVFNPFRDIKEWYRIIGVDDISDLIPGESTSEDVISPTPKSTVTPKATVTPKQPKTTPKATTK